MRKSHVLALSLALIASLKLLMVLNGGAFALMDESRYLQSVSALENLTRGDFSGFCLALSSVHCRPGDAIRNLVPASFQFAAYKGYGLDPRNPDSLIIPMAMNVGVSVLLSYFFFKITLLLFRNNFFLALIGMIIFSLLANNNIYVRHMVPYDASLLFFLIALYVAIREYRGKGEISTRSLIKMGVLSAIGYSIYPGYFFLPVLIYVFFAVLSLRKPGFGAGEAAGSIKRLARQGLIYACPFVLAALLFEVIAYCGKTYSYLLVCSMVSTTITQGSPEESVGFIVKYLAGVEKGVGIILLMCSSFYAICLVGYGVSRKFLRQRLHIFVENGENVILFSTALIGYALYTLAGSLGIVVFYGRILHQYLPFLLWGSLGFIDAMPVKGRYRKMLLAVIAVFSLLSFVPFYTDYLSIAYPRDVLYKYGVTSKSGPDDFVMVEPDMTKNALLAVLDTTTADVQHIAETPPYVYFPGPPNVPWKKGRVIERENYKFVNFCYFYPVSESPPDHNTLYYLYRKLRRKAVDESHLLHSTQPYSKFIPENGWKVVFDKPHFQTFPPYTYEGYSVKARELVTERGYRIKIVKKGEE